MRILRIFVFIVSLCCCLSVQGKTIMPLSQKDVKVYNQIFDAHKKGHYKTARSLFQKLSNKTLSGYVLYDRYFSAKYRTEKAEITSWLKKYSDLPVAPEMYALAQKKKMKLSVKKPKDVLYGGQSKACSSIRRDEAINGLANKTFPYLSGKKKSLAQKSVYRLYRLLQQGKTAQASRLIESRDIQNTFNQKDIAQARTALAFSLFLQGEDKLALSQAQKAIKISGNQVPLSYWTAGLSSWRLNDYKAAASYFSSAATHDMNYPILRGSAAFWAARSYLKLGKYEQVGDYLELASQQPRTFYGMLALRLLNIDTNHVWSGTEDTPNEITTTFSHPALTRFYALKQLGKKEWAEKELAKLYLEADKEDKSFLLAVSSQNGFQQDLIHLAGTFEGGDERFPLPNWRPLNGWKVDKALVFAFVRQESCFNRRAKSSVGARGLMQLMPQTGKAMARLMGISWSLNKLDNAAYNLTLGQNYLLHLLEMPAVDSNLIFTAVAYNAGPGNLIKWKKQMDYQNDPLLFIESIPSRETRSFVERIMVNYWVYRSLLDENLNSMDQLIHGQWPLYRKNG